MWKAVLTHLLTKKITLAKWELNLSWLIVFSLGTLFTLGYLTNTLILPKLQATTTSTKSTDTSTQFSQGTTSSTSVSGSGASAVVQLAGTAGPDGTQ